MATTHFEKLEVYQKAELLSNAIWHIMLRWDGFAKHTVGKQLVRSADSIVANIAESTGRKTIKDRCHFIHMARGSLYETQSWLRRAYSRNLLTDEQTKTIKPLLDALAPMLNAYLRALRTRSKNRKQA
ncbi:MAG: four helix bundle protein [Bacteroidota bacterium]